MLHCHIVLNCDVVLASENKNKFTRKNLLRWKRECREQQRTIGEGGAYIGWLLSRHFTLATCVDAPTQV